MTTVENLAVVKLLFTSSTFQVGEKNDSNAQRKRRQFSCCKFVYTDEVYPIQRRKLPLLVSIYVIFRIRPGLQFSSAEQIR